jgi:OOP family OmpA-OmpF porin
MQARAVLAAAALLASCAAAPPKPAPVDLIVLLPGADGKTGAINVTHGSSQTLLDAAYASALALSDGSINTAASSESAVKGEFSAALDAMPPAPTSFLIYFVLGRDEFTDESRREVSPLLEEIARRPSPEITVIGHADQVGPEGVNDALSLSRAQRVREMLVQRGVAADRISAVGRGKREPLVPALDGTPQPRNRRVEISVR